MKLKRSSKTIELRFTERMQNSRNEIRFGQETSIARSQTDKIRQLNSKTGKFIGDSENDTCI